MTEEPSARKKVLVPVVSEKSLNILHVFASQDSTLVSEVQEFFRKHVTPLVGHRKPSNDAKRYTRRPLVVVYYGVDFSFDYRKGKS